MGSCKAVECFIKTGMFFVYFKFIKSLAGAFFNHLQNIIRCRDYRLQVSKSFFRAEQKSPIQPDLMRKMMVLLKCLRGSQKANVHNFFQIWGGIITVGGTCHSGYLGNGGEGCKGVGSLPSDMKCTSPLLRAIWYINPFRPWQPSSHEDCSTHMQYQVLIGSRCVHFVAPMICDIYDDIIWATPIQQLNTMQ